MDPAHLKIGFIRRGYSRSGGAEAYLKRLATGLHSLGHEAQLLTSAEWPEEDWGYGPVRRVPGDSPLQFADALVAARPACDLTMSLERVWHCDVMRAGDGVHRVWLERRGGFLRGLRLALNAKHRATIRLEESLYVRRGAGRVIANSEMVRREIIDTYGYPVERIDVVYNGVPLEQFQFVDGERERARAALGLADGEVALLFVGSGWERKGLRFAIEAVTRLKEKSLRLFVAGRGKANAADGVTFLGEVTDVRSLYAAADVFVLPTLYDPFSNACLEALAAGLPVITTRANGFSEVIDDGVHGSSIEAGNAEAVAEAIRFWSQGERRAAAKSAIAERAAQFDISRNVARTIEILAQAASAVSTSGKIRKT